ncbi:hypothetical protein AAES_71737 [Amazona aestiva]|uniref:Uncharacterized protein n=1 Tax=Amazona aestiva TaxID=12930 RepID=A0A0Q3TQ63_AMAAE|nr:hypothetical protein AAES_71737 [Amazona aestiva]
MDLPDLSRLKSFPSVSKPELAETSNMSMMLVDLLSLPPQHMSICLAVGKIEIDQAGDVPASFYSEKTNWGPFMWFTSKSGRPTVTSSAGANQKSCEVVLSKCKALKSNTDLQVTIYADLDLLSSFTPCKDFGPVPLSEDHRNLLTSGDAIVFPPIS